MQSSASATEVKAATTLDVEAAKKAWSSKPRQWYRTPEGKVIGFDAYLLAGMHTLRSACPDLFTAELSSESQAWLTANGWPIPSAK